MHNFKTVPLKEILDQKKRFIKRRIKTTKKIFVIKKVFLKNNQKEIVNFNFSYKEQLFIKKVFLILFLLNNKFIGFSP